MNKKFTRSQCYRNPANSSLSPIGVRTCTKPPRPLSGPAADDGKSGIFRSFLGAFFWRGREKKKNERWLLLQRLLLLLFLIIVPLSPSLSLTRKNFRCAESYPRGVGSTIMATGRQGVLEPGVDFGQPHKPQNPKNEKCTEFFVNDN